MATVINGTDNTAATPALTGTDTDTGVFFPAANTMAFSTGGTEKVRVDSAGNVGIGTSSPVSDAKLTIGSDNTESYVFLQRSGAGRFDAAIGNTGGDILFRNGVDSSTVAGLTERMRITSGGELLVGKSLSDLATAGFRVLPNGPTYSTITSLAGSTYHLYSATSGSFRFYALENGGVANFSGNNVNLSDERTKKNIEVAGSYLDKICSIPVKLFNYKDETEGEQRTLGVIAQDVEAVAPEFVNNDGWKGTEPEDGVPLKTIYSTDLMFGMMKAIQELKATVDVQAARIAALEGTAE
jgi:hypothetical protein